MDVSEDEISGEECFGFVRCCVVPYRRDVAVGDVVFEAPVDPGRERRMEGDLLRERGLLGGWFVSIIFVSKLDPVFVFAAVALGGLPLRLCPFWFDVWVSPVEVELRCDRTVLRRFELDVGVEMWFPIFVFFFGDDSSFDGLIIVEKSI